MSALSEALNEANVDGWSSREIARRSGDRIHHATVANFLRGKHAAQPGDEVLRAFVEVFPRLSLQQLRELAGLPAGEEDPYEPPPEAARLNQRQRRAVDELIRSMVTPETVSDEEPVERVEPDLVAVREARRRQQEAGSQPVLQEAARAGTGALAEQRRRQDEAGEAPDPEGPPHGA